MPVQPWIKGNHKRGTLSPSPEPSAFDQRATKERQVAMAAAAVRVDPPVIPAVSNLVETITTQDLPWSASDKKAHLIEVAHSHDLETSGLTKPEIIELLRSI